MNTVQSVAPSPLKILLDLKENGVKKTLFNIEGHLQCPEEFFFFILMRKILGESIVHYVPQGLQTAWERVNHFYTF